MSLPEATLTQIRAHAERDFPRESCGLVVIRKGRRRYVPCRNIAESNEHFVMHPEDYASAEDLGTVEVVVHSHPNIAAIPSEADLVGCEKSGLPWLIVNWPTGVVYQWVPTGYEAPLIGRQFQHGILDCYSLVQDYYARELDIELPDFERPDEWWLKDQNLYLQGFEKAGFVVVDSPRKHDGLLMQVASPVPNHAAIYLGDGCILQHLMGRLSGRDVFGGWYQKIHVLTLRHRSQL